MSRLGKRNPGFAKKKRKGKKKGDDFESGMVDSGNSSARLKKALDKCRKTGNLMLSNFNLSEFPEVIFHLGTEQDVNSNVNWWQCEPIRKLEAPHNNLTAVSSSITKFANELTHLNLQNNQLNSLTPDIADFESLVVLNLSKNALVELPEVLPENLHTLNMQENKLESIPDCVTDLPLTAFNFSKNKLKTLPNQGNLGRLKSFDVSENELVSLPNWLSNCTKIKTINVQTNKLSSIPNLSQLDELNFFRASHNKLTELPRFSSKPTLNIIEVNYNALRNVDDICYQINLNSIQLESNNISELSSEMENMSKLKGLNVKMNNLENIPAEFGRMESLTSIEVDGNPMRRIQRAKYTNGTKKFKEFLLTRIVASEEEKVATEKKNVSGNIHEALKRGQRTRTLNCENMNFTKVPEDVWEVEGIKTLNLSQNKLSNANEQLEDIGVFEDSLKNLLLDKNQFSALPISIVSLYNLQKLSISFNKLSRLPGDIINLNKLTDLNISNNKFQQMPPQVLNMSHLIELHISQNGLTFLPQLQGLRNLRTLHASGNRISRIADGISNLKQLQYVDLQNNEIRKIPIEFGACRALKTFLINGNPQVMISNVIVKKGSSHVLQALRSKGPSGGSPNMTGQGRGGRNPNMMGQGMGGRNPNMMGQGRGGRNPNMMGQGRGGRSPNMMGQGMGGRNPNMMGQGRGGRSPNMMGQGMRGQNNMGQGMRGQNNMGYGGQNNMGYGGRNNMGYGGQNSMGYGGQNRGGGGGRNPQQIAELKKKVKSLETQLKQYGLTKGAKLRLSRELEKTKAALGNS